MVGDEGEGVEAGFGDVAVELEGLRVGAGAGEGEEECADCSVVIFEAEVFEGVLWVMYHLRERERI